MIFSSLKLNVRLEIEIESGRKILTFVSANYITLYIIILKNEESRYDKASIWMREQKHGGRRHFHALVHPGEAWRRYSKCTAINGWHPTETAVPELTSTPMCARTSHEVSHAASGNRFPRSRKPFTKRPCIREGHMRAINILNIYAWFVNEKVFDSLAENAHRHEHKAVADSSFINSESSKIYIFIFLFLHEKVKTTCNIN